MIHLSLVDGALRVDAGPMDTRRLQTVPGIRSHHRASPPFWTCPARIYQARILRSLFGKQIEMTDDVRAHMAQEATLWDARKNRTIGTAGSSLAGKLFPYQVIGKNRLALPGGCLLADAVGMGKSAQALVALEAVDALPALVITTKSTKTAWVREAVQWFPEASPRLISGSAPQRNKQLAAALDDPRALVIIQWDLLRKHSRLAAYGGTTLTPEEREDKELQQFGFKAVIADEAHRMKDGRAKQTRAVWALGAGAQYRWALTGTPIGNEHADLWAILRLLEPEMFPSRSKFLDRYIVIDDLPWAKVPMGLREDTKPELMDILDAYMIRRTPADIPELQHEIPEIREIMLDVELSPKQKSAYKTMRKEMSAVIEGELLTTSNALTLTSRLRYIASALPVVGNEGAIQALGMPSSKLEALRDLLTDGLPLPSVVFAESSKLIDLATTFLRNEGFNVAKVTGAVSERERARIFEEFQAGEMDIVLGTAAMAEGVTLTRGASQVFLQVPTSLLAYTQMSGRVARIGNQNKLIPSYIIVSSGTIDEAIYDLVVAKSVKLEEIVRDKERLLGRV